MASVLAARADGWVVPVVSYTLASCVGYARVNDRAHWASDVIAGGLVGTLIGRTIVRRHPARGGAAADTGPGVRPSDRARDFIWQRRVHGAGFLLESLLSLPLTPRVSGPTD